MYAIFEKGIVYMSNVVTNVNFLIAIPWYDTIFEFLQSKQPKKDATCIPFLKTS